MIQTDEVVSDERALSWLPTLGGWCFAEDAGRGNAINGFRLTPPDEDPHVFKRNRQWG